MKGWIRERAPAAYSELVEIKYIGGDPRFVIQRTYEEFCYKNGEVMSIDKIEELSQETKINSFNADQIEAFLKEHGINPVSQGSQTAEEL